MALLKSLIQRLLDSRTTPNEAAHSAMPSLSSTAITPSITNTCDTWSDAHHGIAPADGYFFATGTTMEPNGLLQIRSDINSLGVTTHAAPLKDIKLVLPVAKGTAIIVSADKVRNITLRFISTIGGGWYQALKNALLQGGVLCRLSRLYSSLRRSSLSIRKDKSLLSLHQFSINTRSTRQVTTAPTNGATLSQLPSADGSELKEIVQALCTLMSALIQTLCDKASTDRADLYRVFAEYLRAAKSNTCSRLAGRYLCGAFFLSRVTAPQLNVVKGGASC